VNRETGYAIYYQLYVNKNALDATYLGTEVRTEGPNPFQVEVANISVDTEQQVYSGIPVMQAKIDGIVTSTGGDPYFMIDFNSDNTVVWTSNCTNNLTSSSSIGGSCSEQPLLL